MKYTEQAVETLDDAGSVIANKNIEIEQLRQRVAELEKERDEWEANSGQWEQEYYKVCRERDKAAKYWQIAEGRCDALMKQRDELVKAMEPFVRHNSSKSVIDLAIRTSDITKARAAIASVKEKS